MITHSSVLAWKTPWTEEPGGLPSMGVTKKSDMIQQPSMHTQIQRQSERTCIHIYVWHIHTYVYTWACLMSLFFSCSIMSSCLRARGLQHARPPCPSPTPGVHPNSCPWSRWCHPTISSSVVPVSSRLQSLQASGSFPVTQLAYHVAKGLELQLQHQSFQWPLRVAIL